MNNTTETDNFRDKISTIDKEGKRVWIYPKKPKGLLYNIRFSVSIFLLIILFVGPFLKINGRPLLLLNILKREFIIFGVGFWPQDFHLFVLATLALIVFIILFTVIFGRLFCGWICPQTVFMEMVFRKIEYFIEGDANNQKKLNVSPLGFNKFFKKSIKHSIFLGISFLIGNTFLAYIIGVDDLLSIITDPPSEHINGLIAMLLFSGAFYFIFAFFREQACTLVCPYGRIQGVLLDKKSIVVAYDFKRGEPRGKLTKNIETISKGDCIDCGQCVDVCPTGIDIRNGTQLECVNCTACIDACNNIMRKIEKPKGLVRYASYNGIELGEKLKLNPRIVGYSTVLSLILILLVTLLATRTPIETTILRTPGTLYQEMEEGLISNLYNIKIINKTFEKKKISLVLKSPVGKIDLMGRDLNLKSGSLTRSSFYIKIPKAKLQYVNTPIMIDVYDGETLVEEIRTSFMGPSP